jgi:uncharacterized protein YjbI with pentapeptide repeats
MANHEHLKIIRQGVDAWNKWRVENENVIPVLSEATLIGANLEGANLSSANLSFANLEGAKLQWANLEGAYLGQANLSGANLEGAYLSGAKLQWANLSGCIISSNTEFDNIIGCQIGVNGFYSEETDSSALMRLEPKGNSMKGSNAEAILESLKYARKLHTYSLTLAGIALLVLILGMKNIPFPYFNMATATPSKLATSSPNGIATATPLQYSVLSIILSTGLCALVATFVNSSIQGAKYLSDRASVMSVAHFPWILSKYEDEKWLKEISIVLRFVICFHPFIYLFVLLVSKKEDSAYLQWAIPFTNYNLQPIFSMVIICIPLFILCGIIFYVSQLFQKPILFDPQTEKERKSDTEKIVEANDKISETNEKLVQKVSDLVELMKPKNGDENTVEEK